MGRSVGGFFVVEKFRLGLVKGDFWDKSRLNNAECKTSGCTALHRRVGEIEVGGRAVERAAEQGGQGCPGRGEGHDVGHEAG